MSGTVDAIIAELDRFIPAEQAETVYQLNRLFDGFRSIPDRSRAVPAMFALLERYPQGEFGSPGPLVHELEGIDGYQAELKKSLGRQPTWLTVWMVNRILNAEHSEEGRRDWLSVLEAACAHPKSSASVQEHARELLDYQLE